MTLPAAVPANVGSVLYVQMRMVAALASMGGFDVSSDQVQTLACVCLVGTSLNDVLKEAGVKVGQKVVEGAIKKIPGKVLVKINQKVGFRLVTKFGEKGIVNLGKVVPVVGGVIGGAFDVTSTAAIAANAYGMFIEKRVPDVEGASPVKAVADALFSKSADEMDCEDAFEEGTVKNYGRGFVAKRTPPSGTHPVGAFQIKQYSPLVPNSFFTVLAGE